jgi:hypothetical protein
MTHAALLKCQKQLRGLESLLSTQKRDMLLAKSYAGFSQWSKDLALRTARRDEYKYKNNLMCSLSQVSPQLLSLCPIRASKEAFT